MQPILHQYKLRLTNLSQGNRSLKLQRLSARRDLDFTKLSFVDKKSTFDLLSRVVQGKSVRLIGKLSARDEEINLLDRRLNNIYREITSIYEESGTYDLYVGYPFVEGKFLDDSIARCPAMLFPVRLKRNFQGIPRWKLEVDSEDEVRLNKTFFLAYEKFQQVRLPAEFWETEIPNFKDIQGYLNWFYSFLKQHQVEVNFNQELFRFEIEPFPDRRKEILEELPVGELKFKPWAVMGLFPQSDSALLKDYEVLEEGLEDFDLGQYLGTDPNPGPGNEQYIREKDRFFVAPVDESQESAILAVKNGQSVVLHGPPGTGKSQVILNLVADAMATGKKVLVVSQKRAALDVVYDRLKAIGLHRFATLVHDYAADRNEIYGHIRRQIEDIESFRENNRDLNLTKWEHDVRLDARKTDELNRFFDELHEALSRPQPCGLSAHELYLLADNQQKVIPLGGQATQFDYAKLREFLQRLEDLLRFQDLLDPAHLWSDRKSFLHYGFEQREALNKQLEQIPIELNRLRTSSQGLADLKIDILDQKQNLQLIEKYETVKKWFETPGFQEDFTALMAQNPGLTTADKELKKFGRYFDKMQGLNLLNGLRWGIFIDLKDHLQTYEAESGKLLRIFSSEYRKSKWFIEKLLEQNGRELNEESLRALKEEVEVLQPLMDLYHKLESIPYFNDLPLTEPLQEKKDWLNGKLDGLEKTRIIRREKQFSRVMPKVKRSGDLDFESWELAGNKVEKLNHFNHQLTDQIVLWRQWFSGSQIEHLVSGIQLVESGEEYVNELKRSFRSDYEDLRSLDKLQDSFTPDEKLVLKAIKPLIGKLDTSKGLGFTGLVRNSFFLAWMEQAENRHPELLEVSTRQFPGKREIYAKLVEQRRKGVVELIGRQMQSHILGRIEYNRLNNPVTYRGIAHQVSKKRRIWPVRKLISNYWEEGLSTLMPVWLASPEAVSAIFPMQRDYFDLVIFDEASQCYVERAIPVLLRGKTTVIAGDHQQLPPGNLYAVRADTAEDAFFENEMALEVESVLDLAKNVLPAQHLSWHYRSREEELINFSNHAFYDGRLKVVPGVKTEDAGEPAIRWEAVQGLWEQNRNLAEAKRVVELIEELIFVENAPSIGVVTFNYQQMETVKDALDERLLFWIERGDDEKVAFWTRARERKDGEQPQGLFVKNIENVQGDERDVIIFSVAYARNEKGKLVTQFGSLSQRGGEKRLNVAITRAREKVIVVCSFDPAELQVEAAAHAGPKLFRAYLEYAKRVSEGREVAGLLQEIGGGEGGMSVPDGQSGDLAKRIASQLEAEGYSVTQNLGDTQFRLDLAVRRHEEDAGFILGIEVEGQNYFSGRSPKAREIYRPELLKKRGWQLERVWAREFFLDPEKVMKRILGRLREIESAQSSPK